MRSQRCLGTSQSSEPHTISRGRRRENPVSMTPHSWRQFSLSYPARTSSLKKHQDVGRRSLKRARMKNWDPVITWCSHCPYPKSSGANAFEISDIERMNVRAHQPGVWHVTMLHALWLREITIRQGRLPKLSRQNKVLTSIKVLLKESHASFFDRCSLRFFCLRFLTSDILAIFIN